jgi:D-3-phosphoglycerate dehydrogenase / 2-oxoglutarate reductase
MGRVVVTDHVFADLDTERELLGAAGHELVFEGNVTAPDDVRARVAGADAVLNCYTAMPREVIEALDGCRIIARYGIGIDTIDLEEASARRILVTNVPDYCIDEVSDHALALILVLARGVARLDRSVRGGSWSTADAPPIHRLRGRVLGLVGFGRIARSLATKAAAVGFRVIASDPYVPDELVRAAGVEPRSLEDLFAEADVLSIHAPLTDGTRHLLGADAFARMKPGAVVVNTSRGPLVDRAALLEALESGRLGGAGLDVLETEPPDPADPLLTHPNVVVTPHAAFMSIESVAELRRKAAEQVVIALAGDTPPYAVNAEAVAAAGE